MKQMSQKYSNIVTRLEELLDAEHCSCCDSLTCDVDVCFDDGYTLWSIELFSGSGASSKEFDKLYSQLPKRFRADAERERKAFVKDTEHATCPHCNAVTWHTEHFDDTIHCESCAKTYLKPTDEDTDKVDLRPYLWHTNNTLFTSWFERDRAMVRLTDTNENEILCMWDADVNQFVEDGFKTSRQSWHDALAEYATGHKLRAERKG